MANSGVKEEIMKREEKKKIFPPEHPVHGKKEKKETAKK